MRDGLGIWITPCGFQIPDPGFWITEVTGFQIFAVFWISNAVILKSKDEYICQTFLDSRRKYFLLAELIDRSSRFSSEKLCVPVAGTPYGLLS